MIPGWKASKPDVLAEGIAHDRAVKQRAGYVQVSAFQDARAGYFCGTCKFLDHVVDKDGFCGKLDVAVRTYGCCNLWQLRTNGARGANGKKL